MCAGGPTRGIEPRGTLQLAQYYPWPLEKAKKRKEEKKSIGERLVCWMKKRKNGKKRPDIGAADDCSSYYAESDEAGNSRYPLFDQPPIHRRPRRLNSRRQKRMGRPPPPRVMLF
eukprot:Sspe_Gene.92128::Locus_63929_Transcript_1_1_Confidence_1.000_Length_451::g.92128::m.92128